MTKTYATPTAVVTGHVTANTNASGPGGGDVNPGMQAESVTSMGFGL
jgi:hypothetical protein